LIIFLILRRGDASIVVILLQRKNGQLNLTSLASLTNNKKLNRENEFIANINIVKNEVPEGTLTQDYALKVMETLSNQLLEFKEIKREETTIKTGNTVRL